MVVERRDHACLVYETPFEQRRALANHMRAAFARGERVLYILDQDAGSRVLEALPNEGLDIEDALDDGALIVRSVDETYLDGGAFDPDRTIALLRDADAEARKDGFRGLSISTEMTWALRGAPGCDRLVEYDAKLDRLFPQIAASAICQYDARRFPQDLLESAIRAHPFVIPRGSSEDPASQTFGR